MTSQIPESLRELACMQADVLSRTTEERLRAAACSRRASTGTWNGPIRFRAIRQARAIRDQSTEYRDALYGQYKVVVEPRASWPGS
jgi:hypothetical protein